jgi:hypothetical protein
MEGLDYWRLCDELSLDQAALLIVGEDPSESQKMGDELKTKKRPDGYDAVKTALVNAVRSNNLKATIRYAITESWNTIAEEFENIESDELDCNRTTIKVDDLRSWLKDRGFRTGFFFLAATDTPDYLNPNHPRYASKLAAAVNAWLAMEDSKLIEGKSPKQALDKWLRENAAKFGLTDSEGNLVKQAIEECSKVANWKQSGGAPPTPGG